MSEATDSVRTVYIVGAGPGDHRLITMAAAEALQKADVVLHDRLVSPVLLALAKDAQLVDVGKTPGGPSTSQQEIIDMMIAGSRRNQRVVRLKGGDPFVFGRGSEEASALAAAGIPMQLVPGISNAISAGAAFGIPATDRRAASTLTIVTGSEGDGDAEPVDWDAVARVGGTIVIMMGWRHLDEIVQRLIGGGLSPDTPSAAIAQAWTPTQRATFAPIGELSRRAADYEPPVTVVIGDVTSLATPEASWSIMGFRILVTRAAAQADQLVKRLGALNAEVVRMPTITVTPIDDPAIDKSVAELATGRYEVVCLTSVNGVAQLWERMARHGMDSRAFANTRVAAIGSETARALAARGIQADIVPTTFTSDALATALIEDGVAGKSVLLARAAQASQSLPDRLREAGANVDEVALYDVATAPADEEALAQLEQGVDVVTLTSPSTAIGLAELAGDRVDLDSLHAVCIGPVTAATAAELGIRIVAVAETHTIEGLAQAVGRYLASLLPTEESDETSA